MLIVVRLLRCTFVEIKEFLDARLRNVLILACFILDIDSALQLEKNGRMCMCAGVDCRPYMNCSNASSQTSSDGKNRNTTPGILGIPSRVQLCQLGPDNEPDQIGKIEGLCGDVQGWQMRGA